MTCKQVLKELESMGNAKMREINLRHGASENQFGVKLGDLTKFAKTIKKDHALAMDLWQTMNMEAMLMATLILDAKQLSEHDLDEMARDIDAVKVIDWFVSKVVGKGKHKEALREKWRNDPAELVARGGWMLTWSAILKGDQLDLDRLLTTIEAEMKDAPLPKQEAMNFCLGEIGIHHEEHRQRCIAIGEKLKVFIDYPVPKGCVTPYVPIWINTVVEARKEKAGAKG